MSISVKHLTKTYGIQKALDDVSFSLEAGEIVGFLGPNGAGKSTTMKIATGYLPPTSGKLEVLGYNVEDQPLEVKQRVGYLPEHNPLYLDMYVHEYLRFMGRVQGLSERNLGSKAKDMVALFGLSKEQNKKIGALSKGYRQRVGLAQSLIHDPQVLILDEPTTGLDPNQIVEIRSLIRSISKDKTVLFSTHIMQEVQALCKRVIIIDNGKIVADRAVETLGAAHKQADTGLTIQVDFKDPVDPKRLTAIPGVKDVEPNPSGGYVLKAEGDPDEIRAAIFHYTVENQWILLEMQIVSQSLEEIFQGLTMKDSRDD